jgi:mono/diheme cytochrome c family protein
VLQIISKSISIILVCIADLITIKSEIFNKFMMKTQLRIVFGIAFILLLAISGCYYDSEEALYLSSACDTTNVTYTKSIAPICNGYCNSCHSQSTAQGGIVTDNYVSVKQDINRIMLAIKHTGPSPMPKGGGSLSECDLAKFDIWVREGMPE